MCLICVSYNAKKMTSSEAKRALREMTDVKHADEVEEMLYQDAIAEAQDVWYASDDWWFADQE